MTMELTADHRDALQEFMNISMGRAANKLATLLNMHVAISVPNIRLAISEDLENIQSYESEYYYTKQSFFGGVDGELITLMSRKGCQQVVADLNKAQGNESEEIGIEESILDISNILSGASLRGLCEQIDVVTKIHPPVLFEPSKQPLPVTEWKLSLIMEISFLVETASFSAKTIICFADKELGRILGHIDELM